MGGTCEQALSQWAVRDHSSTDFIASLNDSVRLWYSVEQRVLNLIAGKRHTVSLHGGSNGALLHCVIQSSVLNTEIECYKQYGFVLGPIKAHCKATQGSSTQFSPQHIFPTILHRSDY